MLLHTLDAVTTLVHRDLEARGVTAIPLIRRELRNEEITDGSSSTKFNYTACEAEFCDNFDWFAANWENKQQKLVHNFSSEHFACCDELPCNQTHRVTCALTQPVVCHGCVAENGVLQPGTTCVMDVQC